MHMISYMKCTHDIEYDVICRLRETRGLRESESLDIQVASDRRRTRTSKMKRLGIVGGSGPPPAAMCCCWLPPSLPPCISLSLSLPLTPTLTLSLSPGASLYLSLPPPFSLSFSHSLTLSLSPQLGHTHTHRNTPLGLSLLPAARDYVPAGPGRGCFRAGSNLGCFQLSLQRGMPPKTFERLQSACSIVSSGMRDRSNGHTQIMMSIGPGRCGAQQMNAARPGPGACAGPPALIQLPEPAPARAAQAAAAPAPPR